MERAGWGLGGIGPGGVWGAEQTSEAGQMREGGGGEGA